MGSFMRMGCNKRAGLVVFIFAIITILTPVYNSYANPLLLARAVLPAVLGRVIASRAITVAANDAVYLRLVQGTSAAITKSVASRSAAIGTSSFFRGATGALTWGGVGYTAGTISSAYFNKNGDYLVATSGKSLGGGKYQVAFGNDTYTIDFEPSEANPFIAKAGLIDGSSSSTTEELLAGHRYYQFQYSGKKPYIVGSITGIAQAYFQSRNGSGLSCSAPSGTACSYTFIVNSVTQGASSISVKYSYVSSYINADGDEKSATWTPASGIAIFTNPNFDPEQEIIFADYKIASDSDGFSAMEALKDIPMDLQNLATTINNLLMDAAAQPDYDGVPVEATNPVTADEIKASYPDYGSLNDFDYMYPAQNSPNSNVNITAPGYDSGANGEDTGTTPPEEYPDNGEPVLEDIPTGAKILEPIANLFPELKGMNIGSRGASCPVTTLDVFEHHYLIDSHCTLIEANKAFIQIIASIVWMIISLRIILSA